jgi:hypothetical protein
MSKALSLFFLAWCVSFAAFAQAVLPPEVTVSPEEPLFIFQSSPAYGDSDAGAELDHRIHEAERHGMEIVRVWRLLPEDIRPLSQIQIELRVEDHDLRYRLFRHMLKPIEEACAAVSIQIADPHDEYVFDLEKVEALLQEFSCIKSLMLSELRFAHFSKFNVTDYAVPPHTRYSVDVIRLGACYGRHTIIVLQGLKWLHISADELNRPLLEAMRQFPDHVIPVNEHIEPRHLIRQTTTWGLWLGEFVSQWGVEPQSWWFESSFMNRPCVYGDHLHPAEMPPEMYRPMIMQPAAMGATVYSFEPWWDLFDYGNSRCWTDVILPSLRELVRNKMIPHRDEVKVHTSVAYQMAPARSIHDFHVNMKDLDWLSDDGSLASLYYGVWQPMLEFELIPNKSNWFFPILPAITDNDTAHSFPLLLQAGQADSEEGWKKILHSCLQDEPTRPEAWTCSMNGFSYVMNSHENLYEKQHYEVELGKVVHGLEGKVTDSGALSLVWQADSEAEGYKVYLGEKEKLLYEGIDAQCLIPDPQPGIYSVCARTKARQKYSGTVNYLDCLVFDEEESLPLEAVHFEEDGSVSVVPFPQKNDHRPASQTVYPTYEGVSEAYKSTAEEIVDRLDLFKEAYEKMNWRALTALYHPLYEDANGFHLEYVSRSWKWWFRRNNKCFLLRQIRHWDFSEYEEQGHVHMLAFLYCTAVRWDDEPFGYDGIVRIPRHEGAEIRCTWKKDGEVWRLLKTSPSLPNLEEILWNSRPMDKGEKLVPGVDE